MAIENTVSIDFDPRSSIAFSIAAYPVCLQATQKSVHPKKPEVGRMQDAKVQDVANGINWNKRELAA